MVDVAQIQSVVDCLRQEVLVLRFTTHGPQLTAESREKDHIIPSRAGAWQSKRSPRPLSLLHDTQQRYAVIQVSDLAL